MKPRLPPHLVATVRALAAAAEGALVPSEITFAVRALARILATDGTAFAEATACAAAIAALAQQHLCTTHSAQRRRACNVLRWAAQRAADTRLLNGPAPARTRPACVRCGAQADLAICLGCGKQGCDDCTWDNDRDCLHCATHGVPVPLLAASAEPADDGI